MDFGNQIERDAFKTLILPVAAEFAPHLETRKISRRMDDYFEDPTEPEAETGHFGVGANLPDLIPALLHVGNLAVDWMTAFVREVVHDAPVHITLFFLLEKFREHVTHEKAQELQKQIREAFMKWKVSPEDAKAMALSLYNRLIGK